MSGGENKRQYGYTIVEVMIVLAISGTMFLMAVVFVAGKQSKTAFDQGVRDMASKMQSTAEEVKDGQYPSTSFPCQHGPNFTGTVNGQGSNQECLFLGKVMHFDKNSDKTAYEVFSVAGNRLDSSGQPATTLTDANPKAIYGGSVPADMTEQNQVSQSLDVTDVKVIDTATGAVLHSGFYGIGFLGSLGATDAAGSLANGSQTTSVYYLPNLDGHQDTSGAAGAITNSNLTPLAAGQKVVVCFGDGTRKGSVAVGLSGDQLTTDVGLGTSVEPAC